MTPTAQTRGHHRPVPVCKPRVRQALSAQAPVTSRRSPILATLSRTILAHSHTRADPGQARHDHSHFVRGASRANLFPTCRRASVQRRVESWEKGVRVPGELQRHGTNDESRPCWVSALCTSQRMLIAGRTKVRKQPWKETERGCKATACPKEICSRAACQAFKGERKAQNPAPPFAFTPHPLPQIAHPLPTSPPPHLRRHQGNATPQSKPYLR